MRELRLNMIVDGRTFSVGVQISENAKLEEYEETLNAMNKAMLRSIKKKYFNFSKRDLLLDCLRKEP